jgi:nicotinamidase-related amidase
MASSGRSSSAPAAGAGSTGAVPAPVGVSVDPATTAYLVIDLNSVVCAANASCVATLPAIARSLASARAAGALVVYTNTVTPGAEILPQVAPQPGDPVIVAHPDKFYGTDLDLILSSHGIKTLVIVGTYVNGGVLYTTLEANLRGYTVVVAEDGVSASSGFIMHYALYQLLNEPGGYANPKNTPLEANAVTLSKTRMIKF